MPEITPVYPFSFPKILDFSFPAEVPEEKTSEVGEVIYIGDGVCHLTGLTNARIDDIVEINTEGGVERALILGMNAVQIEAVVLGDYTHIKRGQSVRATGGKFTIPVGRAVVGRVINPLGQPLDGLGPIHAKEKRDVEFAAPGVVERYPIEEPLRTGILAVDTTIPIGLGQRELVIGDRKTGKTRTMLDIISNQKGKGVHCVYVGVGVQAAKAKSTLQLLTTRGAMKYTTLVMAFSDDPPSIQYIAPYAGAAIAEHYMYQGKKTLIIYDDLSKQAKAYRQVSLLLKRSPGRDAYPGDIFFLHSRLLERAAKLTPAFGGGSMTALPVAETQQGDISDYIITNLMSITDGHIYLDSNMMHEGILPAINSGASVSRIGGKVQSKVLQHVGELASRILARYAEVRSFETINTEVTAETMLEIKRGKRVREVFSQHTDMNMSELEEVTFLGIAVSARMDHMEMDHVIKFKEQFIEFLRQIDTQPLKEKMKAVRKVEELSAYFDTLFLAFCRKYQLPEPPIAKRDEENGQNK
jgi:F-type H+-transporting ATPase subunit alpha